MPHPTLTSHNVVAIAWLLPLLLVLSGCSQLGRNKLVGDDDAPSAIEMDGNELTVGQGTAEELAAEQEREAAVEKTEDNASRRAHWPLPNDAQISMPPIQSGPIIPVSGLDARRGAVSELGESAGVTPRPQAEPAPAAVSTPDPTPRPAAASLAPPAAGTVDKVGADDFHQVVLESDVPVLVDFYADWCGPCKRLSPMLDQVARERTDLRVVKVNYDHDKKLARKYGVQSLPTMIIFKDGSLVAKHTGYDKIEKALGR